MTTAASITMAQATGDNVAMLNRKVYVSQLELNAAKKIITELEFQQHGELDSVKEFKGKSLEIQEELSTVQK